MRACPVRGNSTRRWISMTGQAPRYRKRRAILVAGCARYFGDPARKIVSVAFGAGIRVLPRCGLMCPFPVGRMRLAFGERRILVLLAFTTGYKQQACKQKQDYHHEPTYL